MKVSIIKNYNDLKLKRAVTAGEEFEVTAERGKQLIDAGVAEAIDAPEEKTGTETAEPKAPAKKKTGGSRKKEA
jgi:hypothetical protein